MSIQSELSWYVVCFACDALLFFYFHFFVFFLSSCSGVLTCQESLRGDIVQGAVVQNAAICKKYSLVLSVSNQALISKIVSQTVQAVVANQITLPFFNGVL